MSCKPHTSPVVSSYDPFLAMQFDSSDVHSLQAQHHILTRMDREDFTRYPFLSKEANDLLKGMLSFDPKTRPTTTEIMEHPWFKGSGPDVSNFNANLISRSGHASRKKAEDVLRGVKQVLSGGKRDDDRVP